MSGAAPPTYALLPRGKTVAGRYHIESVIGEGAQSIVYLARRERAPAARPVRDRDPDPQRDTEAEATPDSDKVALKVIHRHLCGDPQIFQRFHREAEILTRLAGEHVVKLFDFIEEDGLLCIALEHVEGTSLEARLRGAPLAVSDAVEITLQICAALGAAHAAGIVHRDLKPANVLLTESTEAPAPGSSSPSPSAERASKLRIKVVDFGLARLMRGDQGPSSLTEQGMIFGTPEYMAPEQARGDEADARSDLYAAGVILFEMAVGELPFKGRTPIGAMTAHLSEAPPSPRAVRNDGRVSPSLEAIILRALAKDPGDRYPSARAFAEAIASAYAERRVVSPPRSEDVDPFGAGDTDLHLPPPSLATAKTVPSFEMSAEARGQLAQVDVALSLGGAAFRERVSDSRPPRATSATAVPATLQSAGAEGGGRSRWLWVLVAIVAAAVGVVIGAIAGTR